MALFKILKGNRDNLPDNLVNGYCYVTLDEHKFYVDNGEGENAERFPLNAAIADKLITSDVGSSTYPVYFVEGQPKQVGYELSHNVPSDSVITPDEMREFSLITQNDIVEICNANWPEKLVSEVSYSV